MRTKCTRCGNRYDFQPSEKGQFIKCDCGHGVWLEQRPNGIGYAIKTIARWPSLFVHDAFNILRDALAKIRTRPVTPGAESTPPMIAPPPAPMAAARYLAALSVPTYSFLGIAAYLLAALGSLVGALSIILLVVAEIMRLRFTDTEAVVLFVYGILISIGLIALAQLLLAMRDTAINSFHIRQALKDLQPA